jgi:hypothetical protein
MRTTQLILLVIFFLGCKTTETVTENQVRKPKFGINAGINKGGITENTDMTLIEDAPVDAFTGATKRGVHAGVQVEYPVGRNKVESGLTYMFNDQTFTYTYQPQHYIGKRSLGSSQFMVPLTFNLGIFRNNQPDGFLQLKIGGLLQYNLISVSDENTSLPDYNINSFSAGLTTGFTVYPFSFDDGRRLGWYVMGYRGSQIYEDPFNLSTFDTPGSSYVKTGIVYQFK